MWNEPTKEELCRVPDLYGTEQIPMDEKQIFMKFFLGGWTWYVTEICHKDWNTMFGFVESPLCPEGEWGHISLDELKELSVEPKISVNGKQNQVKGFGIEVDRDLYTATPENPRMFHEVKGGNGHE